MHRWRITTSLLAILILSAADPVEARLPQAASHAAAPAGQDEAVLSLLQNTVVDADYDRLDFERVIADLRERFKLNIHVSWAALEAAGVRRDQRIEIHLRQITLATMLEILLREASSGIDEPLSYHVQDGVLIITSGERAREDTVMRAYDVSDLLESGYAIRRFANTPVLGLELTGREFVGGEKPQEKQGGGGGGMGGGGGSLFSGEDPARYSEMERIESIINLVIESIDPDTWAEAGGEPGTIRVFGSTMLIRHTMRTHQRIAEFFSVLRGSRPEALDVDATIVRVRADKAAQWRREVGPGFPRLNPQQSEQLAQATAAEGVLFRGSSSGFNGQGLWFSALTQRDVLTGHMPVVAQQVSAFASITQQSTAGLELIVLPLLTPQSDEMTLDVQMAWIPSTQAATRPITLGPGAAETTVDQTVRSMRSVSSTTKLKVGDAIALSIPNQLSDQGAAMEWEDWLVVRVRKPIMVAAQ